LGIVIFHLIEIKLPPAFGPGLDKLKTRIKVKQPGIAEEQVTQGNIHRNPAVQPVITFTIIAIDLGVVLSGL